jgi:hypothetical protein
MICDGNKALRRCIKQTGRRDYVTNRRFESKCTVLKGGGGWKAEGVTLVSVGHKENMLLEKKDWRLIKRRDTFPCTCLLFVCPPAGGMCVTRAWETASSVARVRQWGGGHSWEFETLNSTGSLPTRNTHLVWLVCVIINWPCGRRSLAVQAFWVELKGSCRELFAI